MVNSFFPRDAAIYKAFWESNCLELQVFIFYYLWTGTWFMFTIATVPLPAACAAVHEAKPSVSVPSPHGEWSGNQKWASDRAIQHPLSSSSGMSPRHFKFSTATWNSVPFKPAALPGAPSATDGSRKNAAVCPSACASVEPPSSHSQAPRGSESCLLQHAAFSIPPSCLTPHPRPSPGCHLSPSLLHRGISLPCGLPSGPSGQSFWSVFLAAARETGHTPQRSVALFVPPMAPHSFQKGNNP